MGKLPKSMQEKKRKAKALRAQGSISTQKKATSSKALNRQMRRRMQQQGVEGMDPIEAHRVIIQTNDGDLVIEDPQVIKVKQQGMEIFQVIGSAKSTPTGSYNDINSEVRSDLVDEPELINKEIEDNITLNVEITDQDIQLVVMQTGVSSEEAELALKETNGDLARAIINLKTK